MKTLNPKLVSILICLLFILSSLEISQNSNGYGGSLMTQAMMNQQHAAIIKKQAEVNRLQSPYTSPNHHRTTMIEASRKPQQRPASPFNQVQKIRSIQQQLPNQIKNQSFENVPQFNSLQNRKTYQVTPTISKKRQPDRSDLLNLGAVQKDPRKAIQLTTVEALRDDVITGISGDSSAKFDINNADDIIAHNRLHLTKELTKSNAKKYDLSNTPGLDLLNSASFQKSENPDFYIELENQMESLENDYGLILENFRYIGCYPEAIQSTQEGTPDPITNIKSPPEPVGNPYSLCDGDIADMLFLPLAGADTHASQIYSNLNENIYRPLGYAIPRNRFSMADALHDLIYLDDDQLTIRKELPIPEFPEFKNMILGGFSQIANYAADFNQNKGLISKVILDILKHFHIYWNVKRQQHQVDQTKLNTYSILKAIVKKFREQNLEMRATTIHVLNNIKDGYFKFVKADKLHKLISTKAADLLTYQFLKRYDTFVQVLRDGKYDDIVLFYELSVFLELLRSILTINFKKGVKDIDNNFYLQTKIIDKVNSMYQTYADNMIANNDPLYETFTMFTATLLLKIQHRLNLVFNVYTVQGYLHKQPFTLHSSYTTYIKTFYELMDAWMLVPTQCIDLPRLEGCASGFGLESLNKIKYKNSLHLSVAGANLYRFFEDSYKQMMETISRQNGFDNPESFRNLYFAELFRVSEQYRMNYAVFDMSYVEKLQNDLGEMLEKEKAADDIPENVLHMLIKLDSTLYDFFLNVKNDYNANSPVEKNGVSLNEIRDKFSVMVEKFGDENPECQNEFVVGMFDLMRSKTDAWARVKLNQYSDEIEGPIALTPGSVYTPMPVKGSVSVENIVKEPQIDSGARTPIYMGRN